MVDQLTDSEKKMLRELAIKHGLITVFRRPQDAANSEAASLKALSALSELLLAAKEKMVSTIENRRVVFCEGCKRKMPLMRPSHPSSIVGGAGIHTPDGWVCVTDLVIEALRNSDWGDLFKEKV